MAAAAVVAAGWLSLMAGCSSTAARVDAATAGSGGHLDAGVGGGGAAGHPTSSGGGGGAGGTGGAVGSGGASGDTGGARDGGVDLAADAPIDAPSVGTDSATDGFREAGTDAPSRTPPPTRPPITSASKLDLLFLVDDSPSMAPLQAKLRQRLPAFIKILQDVPGGLPDLHLAVISSSLGAGRFATVPGCMPNSSGDLGGEFQHRATCTQLHPGETFLSSVPGPAGTRINNFDGDLAAAFSCIVDLGQGGCGLEHQFEATRVALQRALSPTTLTARFLREDAHLAVIMFTNEDDCSAPADSDLFDPSQRTLASPLGGLQSYRCNEFGHLCGGASPPHAPPPMTVTLTDCQSNEAGPLVPVNGFVDFLFSLKPNHPEKVFVGAIAGPSIPYQVAGRTFTLATGDLEVQPFVVHSCAVGTGGELFADPGVRLKQWTDAFIPNSYYGSICGDDLVGPVETLARTLVSP